MIKLPMLIQIAIKKYIKDKPYGPHNLFNMSLDVVKDCGYTKLLTFNDEYQEGDLICATSTAKDLWIFVDNPQSLRKALREKTIGKTMIVYRK